MEGFKMKAEEKRMPTTLLLMVFSWLAVFGGVSTVIFFKLAKYKDDNFLISSLLVILGSMLLAAILRMFGNIGQMVFDSTKNLKVLLDENKRAKDVLNEAIIGLGRAISNDLKVLSNNLTISHEENLKVLNTAYEQFGCDLKDMKNSTLQIKIFFEQIEKHLNLKK